MNYALQIMTHLGESKNFSQVLLVAGAPPVEKMGSEFQIVINVVLSPDDIRDTLSFFASHVRRSGPVDTGGHGVFAFGMPKLGRFKVHFLTQRGSLFVSIQRMAFDIPTLESLLSQPGQLTLVDDALSQTGGGIVMFTGPSADTSTRLLYASLARVNETRSMVIYVLEQNLSFLLRHRNSVVIQVDVGTDISSLAEGIQDSMFLTPDLLYVRDPKTPTEYANLMCAAEAGTLVLISVVTPNEQHMLDDLKNRMPDNFKSLIRLIRKTIRVSPDRNGMIVLKEAEPLGSSGPALPKEQEV